MTHNDVSALIIDAAIEVHRTLGGPGLLEEIYEECLVFELSLRGLPVQRQRPVPVRYKGKIVRAPLRLDLIVADLVLVEVKAVIELIPIFDSQLLTYLRLSDIKLGLIINFGETLIKRGIKRIVNGLDDLH